MKEEDINQRDNSLKGFWQDVRNNEYENSYLKKRLLFINTDCNNILNQIKELGFDLEVLDKKGTSLNTYINNILIACDLSDSESNNWL